MVSFDKTDEEPLKSADKNATSVDSKLDNSLYHEMRGEQQKKNDTMSTLALFWWDGLEFFGFDLKKVDRLDGGKKMKWSDKFTNWETTPFLLLTMVVLFYISF